MRILILFFLIFPFSVHSEQWGYDIEPPEPIEDSMVYKSIHYGCGTCTQNDVESRKEYAIKPPPDEYGRPSITDKYDSSRYSN